MAVFKLGAPAVAPDAMIRASVGAAAPDAQWKELGDGGGRAAFDGKRLVAFVNPKTGESSVFPSLEALKPGRKLSHRAEAISTRLAGEAALFPRDGTHAKAVPVVTLVGTRHSPDGKRTATSEYLSYVRLGRNVGDLPVFGPGARAMIGVAEDGSIRALSHRWRGAHATKEAVAPRPRAKVAESIRAQLAKIAESAEVKVDRVMLGYYDGGRDFLQPVYRFEATIASRDRKLHAADRHIFGHVSIGEAPEALPVLGARDGKSPDEPTRDTGGGTRQQSAQVRAGDPTVGRYVVRNDNAGWVASANNFLANLQTAGFFSGIPFADSQYYWAEPFEFISDKDSFVNSVNIALTEVHGNWGVFSTRDNHDDLVFLNTIPAGGYGGRDGGSLAYWILHSCEVVPTQTDESTSFNVWWNIFNGLHAAVGYRTEMWINDGVTSPFGFAIGLGAPVVSAWLNAVASDDSYGANDATYFDNNRKMTEPMGRASAVAVCGHGDDTARDIGPIGKATCLTEWWFQN
jgi:hypothetical protein